MDSSSSLPPGRRRGSPGQKAGLILVGVLSVALTGAASVQIIRASLFPPDTPSSVSCEAGVLSLYNAVLRARHLASEQSAGERAALDKFRQALEPEWSETAGIRSRCRSDHNTKALEALRRVELLRYAEESAVRYEALGLAGLRRKTPAALQAFSPPSHDQ